MTLSIRIASAAAPPPEDSGIYTAPPPLAAWDFKKAASPLGWAAADTTITGLLADDDRLKGTSYGDTAALLSPPISLKPTVHQIVEVRLKVEKDTLLTAAGETGQAIPRGSSPSPAFLLNRNSRLHTVRLLPLWHTFGELNRFRLNLPNAGKFEIEWVRVLDLTTLPEPGTERPDDPPALSGAKPRGPAAPSPAPGPRWNFAWSAEGWNAVGRVDSLQQWIGVLRVDTDRRKECFLLSPPMNSRAETLSHLTLRVQAYIRPRDEKSVGFFWIRQGDPSLHSRQIRLTPGEDFQEHVVRLADAPEWSGKLLAVGLEIPADTLMEVDFVRLGQGPLKDTPPPSTAAPAKPIPPEIKVIKPGM